MKSLTDNVPLRRTTVWGGYKVDEVIPIRIGETSGRLTQYDQERRTFVWSDASCETVARITSNGQDMSGWQFRNGLDKTNHPVCFVIFDQPVDENVELVAYGKGMPHPLTGELMTNPADVIWYFLTFVVGNPVSYDSLGDFRTECRRLNIQVHGSFYRDNVTIQSEIRDISQSIGAVFCASSPGMLRIFPQPTPKPSLFTITDQYGLSVEGGRKQVVNDLTVNFAYDNGTPKESIQLEVPTSIARYGRLPRVINATWINSGTLAFNMGVRLLTQLSRIQWTATAKDVDRVLGVGDFITLNNQVVDDSEDHMVLSSNLNIASGKSEIRFSIPLGQPGSVKLVRQSIAFSVNVYASATVTTVGTERVLTLKNDDGTPMVGAQVTLDGLYTRTTDSAGRVTFPADIMPLGEHQLRIVTLEGQVLETTVIVN